MLCKLIRVCRIQWRCPFFLCARPKTRFLGKFGQKNKIVSLSWDLVPRLIPTCRIQWHCSFFSVSDRKHRFWGNLVQKVKIVTLSWNLVLRLIPICKVQWWCLLFLFILKTHFLVNKVNKKRLLSLRPNESKNFSIGRCH